MSSFSCFPLVRPLCLALFILTMSLLSACDQNHTNDDDSSGQGYPELDVQVGQMLMIGFRGTEFDPHSPIASAIRTDHIGGIVLFDKDALNDQDERNIASPEQTAHLIADLQTFAQGRLMIAVDQEGGYVNRLKPKYGFPPTLHRPILARSTIPI